jgi:hypothetical protein
LTVIEPSAFADGSVIPVAVVLIVTTTIRRRGWIHDDVWLLCSFQGPQGGAPQDLRAGLSKLNSMLRLELGGMPGWPGQVRSTY